LVIAIDFIAKPTSAMADPRWYFDKNWGKRRARAGARRA
jgi:hypothetical protein